LEQVPRKSSKVVRIGILINEHRNVCGSGKIMIMTPLIKYYKKEKKVEGRGLGKTGE